MRLELLRFTPQPSDEHIMTVEETTPEYGPIR